MMAFFIKLKVTGNLKTFIKIMGVSLKFNCCMEPLDYLEVEVISNRLHIDLTNFYVLENSFTGESQTAVVVLDKSTAIKLSKELRKQIALLD